MIKKQTVFVLGAGASVPYGYPTGNELRNSIIDLVDFDESNIKEEPIETTKGILQILTFYGHSKINFNEFLHLKKGLLGSSRSSIDIFLENRPQLCDIGKRCIAWDIIHRENTDILSKYDWFEHLHDQELANDCSSSEKYCENNIDFITFNYDRLLEYSLITRLKETYDDEESYCGELIKENFNIVHVHGKLNDLPWENKDGRKYGKLPNSQEEWKKSADGIKIIHEKQEEESFKKARELINDAELIVFLGLNLHNTLNLNRLNIKDNLEGKNIYATLIGLSGPQKEDVIEYFNNKLIKRTFGGRQHVGFPNFNALNVLKEQVRFR